MPHSNVFIRGVPIGFDTEDLRYLFEQYGLIVSVKILEPRHFKDKRLGFVKFSNREDALSAIQSMNMTQIGGQYLEVREAELDVNPKKNLDDKVLIENDNLFVRGFPSYWGPEELTKYFSQTGVVVAVRVLGCTMPTRGGVGLVRFGSIEEAKEAVKSLNGIKVDGFGPIDVKFATVKDPNRREILRPFRQDIMAHSRAFRNIDINAGLSPQITNTTTTLSSDKSLPFNCVIDEATTMNNDVETASGSLTLMTALPTPVFIDNLPPTVTQLVLYQNFAPFGAISSVILGQDETEACSGVAFVNFVESADAVKASLHMNRALIHGFFITVSCTEQ